MLLCRQAFLPLAENDLNRSYPFAVDNRRNGKIFNALSTNVFQRFSIIIKHKAGYP